METKTEIKELKWEFISPSSIKMVWSENNPTTKTAINWRGEIIEIFLWGTKTEYGFTRKVTFLHNGKSYDCYFTKHKWMAGSHGDKVPEISIGNYKLNIHLIFFSLQLTDVVVEPKYEFFINKEPIKIIEPAVIEQKNTAPIPISKSPDIPIVITKNEILLYEKKEIGKYYKNSYASIKDENLVVDDWELTGSFENEKFITVYKKDLNPLFDLFKIQKENNAELLIAIAGMFNGEYGFKKFEQFLEQKGIKYANSNRQDNRPI